MSAFLRNHHQRARFSHVLWYFSILVELSLRTTVVIESFVVVELSSFLEAVGVGQCRAMIPSVWRVWTSEEHAPCFFNYATDHASLGRRRKCYPFSWCNNRNHRRFVQKLPRARTFTFSYRWCVNETDDAWIRMWWSMDDRAWCNAVMPYWFVILSVALDYAWKWSSATEDEVLFYWQFDVVL